MPRTSGRSRAPATARGGGWWRWHSPARTPRAAPPPAGSRRSSRSEEGIGYRVYIGCSVQRAGARRDIDMTCDAATIGPAKALGPGGVGVCIDSPGARPQLRVPLLVDPVSNAFDAAYAPWPLRFYILRGGRVEMVAEPRGCSYVRRLPPFETPVVTSL
mmetsp:Transcript_65432/g.206773  ORF Transcript_65432/g.206773 Transcript_65432/m.206773 type:complete len:159 (-) Transcript_65432:154-630(-)